jgi:hypothetical protein
VSLRETARERKVSAAKMDEDATTGRDVAEIDGE